MDVEIFEVEPCRVAGESARRFVLANHRGVRVEVMEYGATVLSVQAPDAKGRLLPLTCGLNHPQDYSNNPGYLGATCGRFAGRIAQGRYSGGANNEPDIVLSANDGRHCLHGGAVGFNHRLWAAEPFTEPATAAAAGADAAMERVGVRFGYTSADGDQGFPGELTCQVTMTLDNESGLTFAYQAEVAGQPTVINLTNHTYWNLGGQADVLGHQIQINADAVLELDSQLIPTGVVLPVASSAFDFRSPQLLNRQMQKLPATDSGFDHCFVRMADLNSNPPMLTPMPVKNTAMVTEPSSGFGLHVVTDQLGLVFYTGNFLDGSAAVGGHSKYGGLALECQALPDAPNHSNFGRTWLVPGQTYRQTSRYEILLPAQ